MGPAGVELANDRDVARLLAIGKLSSARGYPGKTTRETGVGNRDISGVLPKD